MLLMKLLIPSASWGLSALLVVGGTSGVVVAAYGQAIMVSLELFQISGVAIELPLFLDRVSCFFLFTVSLISLAVFWFSLNYMSHEKFFTRFHVLVLSFVSSMYLLILSPSLISVLLGWDGLGVTSYLLVIYFNSSKSFNAGMLTALTNRLGDCLILISLGVLFSQSSWHFFLSSSPFSGSMLPALGVGLLAIAAMTKSAQVPFSAWLPAAMAAPTPVSSLVHSSTLVTAGVYLMVRFGETLASTGNSWLILVAGALTMLLAGFAALGETDMKKVVALSTLSQLGLMMGALGTGLWEVAFFHLLTHAYFKALLFMTVGNMIHLSADYQDLRMVGLAEPEVGMTLSFGLVANFSLMGIPFLSGFYSKDLIMELVLLSSLPPVIVAAFFIATLLTSAYTIRFLFLTSWGSLKSHSMAWVEDSDKKLFIANLCLWPLAMVGGSGLSWALLSNPSALIIPWELKIFTPISIMAGVFLGLNWTTSLAQPVSSMFSWSWGTMWSLPLSSARPPLALGLVGSNLARSLDLTWVPTGSLSPVTSFRPQGGDLQTSTSSGFELTMLGMLLLALVMFYLHT